MKRRLTFTIILLTAVLSGISKPAVQKGKELPNIIIILADDMGYSDIGCYGAEIKTPHLDRLAHEGVRFSIMYKSARCCPSRAALLSGLYPHTSFNNETKKTFKKTLSGCCAGGCSAIESKLPAFDSEKYPLWFGNKRILNIKI